MIEMNDIKKVCEGSDVILMITNKGMYAKGTKADVATLFIMMCENLIENGFSKEELKGLLDLEVSKKEIDTEKLDKMLEKFKEFSEALKNIKEGK